MKKVDVLTLTAVMMFLQAFLFRNVFPSILAFAIIAYLASVRFGFRPNLSFLREFEGKAVEGRPLKAVLSVENGDKRDYEVEVIESLPRGFSCESVRFKIGGLEKRTVIYSVIPKRGVYDVGGPTLRVTDSRRLYCCDLKRDGYIRVEVYPDVEEIIRKAGEVRVDVSMKTILGAKSDEVESLRRYQPGDDIRFIDWKATARLMELIVKEFSKEMEGDVYIVLDAGREMTKGVKEAKINYATTLAIQLAYALRGRRVGFVVYDDFGVKYVIRASSSIEQIEKFVRSLKFTPTFLNLITAKIPIRPTISGKSIRFVRKVRGRFASGVLDAISRLPSVSALIFIADITAHTNELIRILTLLKERYSVYLITPNPVLFYDKAKINREKLIWL